MTKEQKFEARLTEMGLLAEWENQGRLGRVATTDANGNIILFVHEGETDWYSEEHYPPLQVLRQNYKFVKGCILEWRNFDEEFEKKLDDWLAYGMCSETGCPLDPVDVYFPANGLQTSCINFEDDPEDVLSATLERFLEESARGETSAFPSERFGINTGESLFMTNIERNAVLIHYGTCGDWTRAVLIPSEEFYNDGRADDALGWFLNN